MAFNILDAARRLVSGSNTGFYPEEPVTTDNSRSIEGADRINFGEQADITAAANLYGMAMAALIHDEVLTVGVLMRMGQEIARYGVSTWRLVMRAGELSLQPARLSREGDAWQGTVELPDGQTQEVKVADDGVLDVALPGRRSPIADSSAVPVARSLEARIARNLNTGSVWTLDIDPIGYSAMTRPQRGDVSFTLSKIMADVAGRGTNRVAALPPGVRSGTVFGSQVDPAETDLRRIVRQTVEAAYGINGLLASDQTPDGAGDAWRVATRRTFLPLSRLIADEARRKLEREIEVRPRALIPNAENDAARRQGEAARSIQRLSVATGITDPDRLLALLDRLPDG